MKRLVIASVLLFFVGLTFLTIGAVVSAEGPSWVVVNPGETIKTIAVRYGTTAEALMHANSLPNLEFVYSGQRLLIPGSWLGLNTSSGQKVQSSSNANVKKPLPANVVYYTAIPGDTLAVIAARFGVSVSSIAESNNLSDWNFAWYGQRLIIPNTNQVSGLKRSPTQIPVVAAPKAVNPPTTGKWIDINVTDQTITAYEGSNPLKTVDVSTGVERTPTVLGTYKITRKYEFVHMTGGTPGIDFYDLPDVPYSMFFYQGYAIHGTYWHTNFGRPMSHGCVNLPTEAAKWFYEWAPVGTVVISHL